MKRALFAPLLAELLLVAGCTQPPPAPTGTGAREKAKEFFEALVARDWDAGFAALDADSQGKLSPKEFARRGEHYLKQLGFTASKVHVRFCDEKDASAMAHVLLTTATDSRKDSFRESIQLKRDDNGWRVVLPKQLGR